MILPKKAGTAWKIIVAASLLAAGIVSMLVRERVPEGAIQPQITAGDGHALFLSADGRLSAWGQNESGQLGDGTGGGGGWGRRQKLVRGKYRGGPNGGKIERGDQHCRGIQFGGRLWAGGRHGFGQVGKATVHDCNLP